MVARLIVLLVAVLVAFSGCASGPGVKKGDPPAVEAKKPLTHEEENRQKAKDEFTRALMLMNHGRYKDVEKSLLEVIRLEPGSYNAHMLLGSVYLKLNQNMNAIKQFEEAQKIDPKDIRSYRAILDAYANMGLLKYAVETGEKAIKNGIPEDVIAIDLGWFNYAMGDLDQAEAYLTRAEKKAPENTTVLNDLGLVYFSKSNYEAAAEYFRKAMALNEKSTIAPLGAAFSYLKMNKEDEAVSVLTEALKKIPDLKSKVDSVKAGYFMKGDPGDLSGAFEKSGAGVKAKE